MREVLGDTYKLRKAQQLHNDSHNGANRQMTLKERKSVIDASSSIMMAIQNVRRALRCKHPLVQVLGESAALNLVNFDNSVRSILERR